MTQKNQAISMTSSQEDRQTQARAAFESLRDRICTAFEAIEDDYTGHPHTLGHTDLPPGRFERKAWDRPDDTGAHGGGGVMSIMRGRVFEKVGVNVSTVHGTFSPEFRPNIPGATENGGAFFATGISLVAHMRSPLVPAVHMNTRLIATSTSWFGGGADINPTTTPDPQEIRQFHAALQSACDAHDPAYYQRYADWCERYFHLPHRGEQRGEGGIFFDNLATGNWQHDFSFTKAVGEAFLDVYPKIVRGKMNLPWTAEQREAQLIKRGRYAEFNLLYDRGTTFGLKTGGNVEAILMSLPPEAKWP